MTDMPQRAASDYLAALPEIQRSVGILRGDDAIPFQLLIGVSAYARLRRILDQGEDPGVPNAWGSAPRSLLMLVGLPTAVDEMMPPNAWYILSRDGNAIQVGILNDLADAEGEPTK